MCSTHYTRWQRGDVRADEPVLTKNAGQPCSAEGCTKDAVVRGMCRYHYQIRPDGPRCSVDGCDRTASRKGYCASHYNRWYRHGDPLGGRHHDGRVVHRKSGYVMIRTPGHPAATKAGYVAEHRLVMEQILGRYLLPDENIHHINGVRDDNRPENLELWVTKQPKGQRPDDLVAWAREILARYG